MSLNIITSYALQIPRSRILQAERKFHRTKRAVLYHSFSDRSWNHGIHNPSTPTTERPAQPVTRIGTKHKKAHRSSLSNDDVKIGQLGGGPAKAVSVDIDGKNKVFDAIFLRDSCPCKQCKDPHSTQKSFQTSDIPEDIECSVKATEHAEKGACIEIEWKSDVRGFKPDHRTTYSLAWLRSQLNTEAELKGGNRYDDRVYWDKNKIIKDNKWVDYLEYMSRDETLFDALRHLHQYGLLFIKDIPDSEESVVEIASRIGNLKDTFYGRTWDVRSEPKAKNVAYTPVFLGLHMDLLYTSSPPHLQLLHSLRARAPGGESFFSDSFHAAHKLHQASAAQFKTLCEFPVTYQYHHPTFHYHFNRPTIELFPASSSSPSIKRVNWSPPFQGPFEAHISDAALRPFVAASHAYEKILSAKESLYEYRLNEGECVIFDNRRILHARKAFDATKGERWLKGAYVDDDVFFSRLRVLEEKFEGKWVSEGVVRRKVEP